MKTVSGDVLPTAPSSKKGLNKEDTSNSEDHPATAARVTNRLWEHDNSFYTP